MGILNETKLSKEELIKSYENQGFILAKLPNCIITPEAFNDSFSYLQRWLRSNTEGHFEVRLAARHYLFYKFDDAEEALFFKLTWG